MTEIKVWKCPKCDHEKQTDTSTRETYHVKCGVWYECIAELGTLKTEPIFYDVNSAFPVPRTKHYRIQQVYGGGRAEDWEDTMSPYGKFARKPH